MVVIMIIGKLNLILCTSSYNSNDYLLAAYLIKKSNQIESIKMVDILKDTKVSKSTLLRFLKKLGYKNYTDVQYLITKEKKHQEIFKERIIEKNLRDKLAKKQRLIVIGDSYSVSSLIVYKQKFYEIGIDLDIQLSLKSYGQMVVEKKFTGSDLIIVVSLYKSDLDLMAEFFSGYLELKHFIKEQLRRGIVILMSAIELMITLILVKQFISFVVCLRKFIIFMLCKVQNMPLFIIYQ